MVDLLNQFIQDSDSFIRRQALQVVTTSPDGETKKEDSNETAIYSLYRRSYRHNMARKTNPFEDW